MFSIVMPLYNKEPHVALALSSVLAQTRSDWELLVIDDGSTDGGPDLVRKQTDPRLRLIVQENQGPSGARNRGIADAKHAYVAFLDADDEWLPHHLEDMARLIENFPQAAVFAQAFLLRKNSIDVIPPFFAIPRAPWEGLIPNYFVSAKPGAHPVWTSAVVIPKKILVAIGGFPEGIPRGQDLECWALAALHGPVAFSHRVGAVYFKDSVNGHGTRKRLIGRKLGIERALEEGRVPEPLVKGVKLYVQRLKLTWYAALVKEGRLAEAKAMRKTLGASLGPGIFAQKSFWFFFELLPPALVRFVRSRRGNS